MAKNEAKVKFTADTSAYNEAIKKSNDTMSQLRAEMKLNDAQMQTNGKSIEGLKQKQKLLQSQLKVSEDKTQALNQKIQSAIRYFGEDSAEVIKLKTQLANAQTAEEKIKQAINACNEELAEQSNASQNAGKAMGNVQKQAKNTSKSLDDVDESAGKAGETLSNIGGTVVKGVVAGFTAITAVASAAVGAFLGSAEATRDYREEQTKLDASFKAQGKSAKTAEDTYNSLFKVIGESDQAVEASQQIALLAKSEEDAAKWASYASGVVGTFGDALQPETFYESANETMKLGEATGAYTQMLEGCGMSVEAFNQGLAKCKTEEEKQAYMLGITEQAIGKAGKAYEEANASIFNSNVATAKLNESMAQIGAAAEPVMTTFKLMGANMLQDLSPAVSLIGEGLTGALNGVEGSSEKLAQGVGGILKTVGTLLVDVFNQIVAVFPSLMQTLLPTLITGLVNLFNGIVTAFPSIVSALMDCLPALISGVEQLVNSLVQALPQIIQAIVTALPTLIPLLITAFVNIITTICSQFSSIIQPIIDALPDIIISVVEAIVNNLPALIQGIITLIMGIVQAIPQIIQSLVDALPTVISLLVTAIIQNLPAIISGLIQVVWGIVKALPKIFASLIEGVANVLSGVWDALGNVFGGVGDWFGEKFSAAKEKASEAWANAKEVFGNIWGKTKEAFANVGSWFKDKFKKGYENSKNAWANAKSAFSNIKDKVVNAFSDIKEKLSKPFEKAKNSIKNIADRIFGFFKGEISMPKIKTPKFSIKPKGWEIGDLLEGSIPKLSISWHAKGGIFTKPTLINTGNSIHGVGEAGAEAILPIDRLEDYIENSIERTQQVINFDRMANAIERLAERAIELKINDRTIAEATASANDNVSGLRNILISRGLVLE